MSPIHRIFGNFQRNRGYAKLHAHFNKSALKPDGRMIIVRLRGGLGNQLFQYAAGYSLAKHHRTELALDLYTYTKHPYRKFELNKFQLPIREATRAEIHRFTGANPVTRFINKQENYLRCPDVFAQPHYHFYDDFFQLPPNLYLSGYWHSEKYFDHHADVLRACIQPVIPFDATSLEVIDQMQQTNSVSVHVRLGDYASNPAYQSFFGSLDKSYYEKAFELLEKEVQQPHYFVFSDDVQRAKSLFGSDRKITWVQHNKGEDSYRDLLLMARCQHHVIANSTFSWWGAWLNSSAAKKVIAPLRWFNTSYSRMRMPVYPVRLYNTKDLIPPTWIRI